MSTGDAATVMICMDGSKHSTHALKYYKERIHRPENQVTLVYCAHYAASFVSISMPPADPTVMHTMVIEEEKRIKTLLEHIHQEASQIGLDAKVVRVDGDPGHTLLEKAKELNASLIVTGSRGMGTVRRTFMGSVSDYLIHHAHVPVLVCKHEHHFHPNHH